ncbi:hypothetical protein [Henriciella pelagia]|uniref:hypothetical protein n=1 Tax=Henriciella pelagia TaxID=1977912 RepID=UPI003515A20A
MKRLVFASVAALAMVGTASADFIDASDGGTAELTIEITGTVEEICGITASGTTLQFDYGELAGTTGTVPGGVSFGLVCNAAAGATVGVSSANNGYLLRNGTETGPGNQIPYSFDLDKGDDEFSYALGTRPESLTSDRTYPIAGSAELRQGREVGAYIVVDGVKGPDFQGAPTPTVFAGDYSDIITLSLTAN